MLRTGVSLEDGDDSGGGFLSNVADSVRGLLPSTGGAAAVLGVGIPLIFSGLAVRRSFR